MRRLLILCAALALGGGLGACGDDGDKAASPPTTAEETINPCAPEADPSEIGLEGDAAPAGATIHEIRGVEYRFEGVPPTLPAGPHGFKLVGAGAEFHELALVRVESDRPVLELLDLPEKEQEKAIPYLGGLAVCPGTTSAEAVGGNLTPGRYALICFIPTGTTPDLRGDDLLAAYENEPHFAKGMLAEFVVEAAP